MKHIHFIVGVSVGTGPDSTALAIIEQEVWQEDRYKAVTHELRLRHLERLPLEGGFPETRERVVALLQRDEIKDAESFKSADVILDITGASHAIVDLFRGAGIRPLTVTISGTEVDVKSDAWRVPKMELVGNLLMLYQSEKLKMASELDLTDTFVKELQDFRLRPPPVNPKDPEAWRERQHDDLIFAVAVAAWRAHKHVPRQRQKVVYPPGHVSNNMGMGGRNTVRHRR